MGKELTEPKGKPLAAISFLGRYRPGRARTRAKPAGPTQVASQVGSAGQKRSLRLSEEHGSSLARRSTSAFSTSDLGGSADCVHRQLNSGVNSSKTTSHHSALQFRRLLRAIGSCNKSSAPFSLCKGRAFSQFPLSGKSHCLRGLRGCAYGYNFNSVCSPALEKATFSFYQRYSSSVLTPNSSEGTFPPHLLSSKHVLAPDREMGLYQDLVIPVTNFHNENKGFMVLAGDVFDVPIRKDIIHRVVRWQLAKRQQGTHSTKTISEVSGTGRKPWRQKGTGRARHGTLRGPQFRGGATMHGPKPRSHAIKLNKKLIVFEDLEVPSHKTKNVVNYVQQMENAKKLLVVDGGPINEKLKLATQNLHYVNVLPSIGLNVYSILLHDTLVMSRDAVNSIVERMHTPINR
ncbi:50S ribosomal protein L4 [Striga asiatica]|uniref:Large ribosomal subunit protein uL4m n=1 Tax=Striga asiatica TaxID=4170 RepID=A0A5A7QZ89_STRAF|nr:50S ribosomal protein L4 [Striga asiatica]